MKGRSGDYWQKNATSLPVREMVRALSKAGFNGIYIDSYGYQDHGVELISEIKEHFGKEPLVSPDQRLYFFDMTGSHTMYTEKKAS